MPIQKTEAFVLNKFDFRETSMIATFYTRDHGKISGILKGIRAEPGKFASSVEPFSLNEIIFYHKRSTGLHLVSQCELKEDFTPIRQSVAKVCCASMLVELVNALMPPEDKHEGIYQLALDTLKELATTTNPDKVMMIFKFKILDLSGFKPNFQSCVCCGNRISGESKFSLSLGGLLCLSCFRKDLASRSVFRGTVASILHIQKNDFRVNLSLGMNPEIKKELDLILNSFLNFHLEKELKSQKVINKLETAALGGER